MDTQESVPHVNGPAEPIPDRGTIITVLSLIIFLPQEYTTVAISNSKGVKATMPTPLAMKLLAQGHMGIFQPEILLPKDPFNITLGCYSK